VAAALAVLATACGQGGEPEPSKPFRPSTKANGLIAFSQWGDDYGPLFAVRPSGGGLRKLTPWQPSTEGNEVAIPAWSPDGKALAFLKGENFLDFPSAAESADLYRMTAAAGPPTRLTKGLLVHSFDWSPDAKRIAYAAKHADGSDAPRIYVTNADGSGVRALTSPGIPDNPAWSPDGSRIAFVSIPSFLDQGNVFVMSADGSDQRQLTHKTLTTALAWSPDGQRIAFQDYRTISVVDADGSDLRRLTENAQSGGNFVGPRWSPDGTRIAFVGQGNRVYVMSADGSAQRPITKEMFVLDGLSWSPDGKKLAYVAVRLGISGAGEQDIHVVNANGSGDRRLRSGVDAVGLSWQPLAQ